MSSDNQSVRPGDAVSDADTRAGRTDDKRELARGGGLSFFGSASSALLGFLLTVVITRLMGADGAGVVFQATGVFAVVLAFAKVGMDSTAVYLLPRVRLDDVGRIRSTIMAFVIIAVLVSTILAVALQFIAPLLWPGPDNPVSDTVRALAVFIPAGAVMLIAAAILRALGSVREYVLVSNIAIPALRPPLVAVAAVATGSVVVVSVAWALPLALMMVVAAVMVSGHVTRLEGGDRGRSLPSRMQVREIISFATPRTASAGLEQAIIWVDVLLVGWLLSDQAAGIYGGAARFIQAGLVVDAALRVVVSPRFSSLLHQEKKEAVRELYITATIWLVLIASPIYVLLAVFSPVFLDLLGPDFRDGSMVLSILAVGITVTFLAGNIHSLLIMSGRSGWAAINKVVVLVINIVGNLLLVPVWGIEGAAVVWAVSMLIDALLAAVEVSYFLGIRVPLAQVLRPLGLVVVTWGIPAGLSSMLGGQTLGAAVLAAVVGGVLYLAACWYWRGTLRLEGLRSLLRSR